MALPRFFLNMLWTYEHHLRAAIVDEIYGEDIQRSKYIKMMRTSFAYGPDADGENIRHGKMPSPPLWPESLS